MRSLRVEANGLAHHVLAWEGDPARTVVVLHGYLDVARSFAPVAGALAARGFRVLAPDLRGHGDTDRAPAGAYYHFPDYVADVAALLDALAPGATHVVGHSMGGSVATYYAGALPERVASLALLEGVGPPAMPADVAPDRYRAWLASAPKARARGPRRLATADDVYRRLRASHPDVDAAALRRAVPWLAREVDGGWEFRFDPLHQTLSPGRFDAEAFECFADRVACPVLLVDGGAAGHLVRFEGLAARAAHYRHATRATVAGGGHMMHWTRPDAVAALLVDFLSERG